MHEGGVASAQSQLPHVIEAAVQAWRRPLHPAQAEVLPCARDAAGHGRALHGHIHTHDGAIAVLESNCPHQDCVHMGYVSETNHPIICAYNQVYIVIEGDSNYDARI